MTKVTYKDEGEALREIVSSGVRFKRGVPREVPDHLLPKFQGNAFFEVEGMPYKRSEFATSEEGDGSAGIDNSDEAVNGTGEGDEDNSLSSKDEDGWDAGQLTHVLLKRNVSVKKAIADDPNKLLALAMKNGGEPTEAELADYSPAE